MRIFNHSWFIRRLKGGERWSVGSFLFSPILLPIYVAQLVLIGTLIFIILVVMWSFPRALDDVAHAVRAAEAGDQADEASENWEGGWFRQAGYESRGSLIRPGGSLSSGDIRRRLDELRSTDPGGPGRRALNRGGQHGQ